MSVLRGLHAAVLTPLDSHLRPDASVAIPYYRSLLDRGLDGLNVLGTTGEAMSIGTRDRASFMAAVAAQLPRERLMVGTGASALSDAAELTRTALDCGYAAALVIPPFYYRDHIDEGILAFFDALFARVHPPAKSIMLYNFPRMSGATFNAALVQRLWAEFPGVLCGLKDSSNTKELERDLHACLPQLDIFPGSESLLGFARDAGLAGFISGSVCLWPEAAAAAWREGKREDVERVTELRASLDGLPLIQTVRERVALEQGNPAWRRSIPPLGTPVHE